VSAWSAQRADTAERDCGPDFTHLICYDCHRSRKRNRREACRIPPSSMPNENLFYNVEKTRCLNKCYESNILNESCNRRTNTLTRR